MHMTGVAMTGWAWRTPLGDGVQAVLARLHAGERACAPLRRFPGETYECRWAAELARPPVPSRHRRFLRRMGLHAMEVAREVMDRARPAAAGDRLGLFFGYGGLRAHWEDMMPALAGQGPDGEQAWARGLSLLHPFWMLQHLSNNAHALAAEELGACGDGLTLGGANAGAQALAAAAAALAAGVVDAALVVAYDTLVEPETLVDIATRGAYVGGDSPPPAAYGTSSAGYVPGEAAAAVLLERPESAHGRAMALVQAWHAADGEPAEPRPDTLARALAPLRGDAPAVIDGAARAVLSLDSAERSALAEAFGPPAHDTPICATLSAMGQLGATASVVQTIAIAAGLQAGRLPPIAGLTAPAPGALRPLIAGERTAGRVGIGLSTGAPGLVGIVRVELP